MTDPVGIHFQRFADTAAVGWKLPLYRRLCLGTAADPEVLALLNGKGAHDNVSGLLLAAVHDCVLADQARAGTPTADLAAWYSSVTAEPRSVGTGVDDPWPAFRAVCLGDPRVAERVATKGVQTNEVGRSAALLPAFGVVQAAVRQPLDLIELGCSAGLNLFFDRYSYEYTTPGVVIDPPSGPSPLRLRCRSEGPELLAVPVTMPDVASRVGVDLDPVDVQDKDASRWLVACMWPDQPHRVARAQVALSLARSTPPDQRPSPGAG